jgi:cation transport ATPase
MSGGKRGGSGAERGALGRLVRVLSLATLAVVYVGSLVVTYRQLQAKTSLEDIIGAPDWTRAVLIMGLVVGGGLGTAAAVVDSRPEMSSWVLTIVGVASALAWSLWATERGGEPAVHMLFAAAAPVISLLVWAELMRQFRNRRH